MAEISSKSDDVILGKAVGSSRQPFPNQVFIVGSSRQPFPNQVDIVGSSRQHFPKKEEGGGRPMLLVFDEDIDRENHQHEARHDRPREGFAKHEDADEHGREGLECA